MRLNCCGTRDSTSIWPRRWKPYVSPLPITHPQRMYRHRHFLPIRLASTHTWQHQR